MNRHSFQVKREFFRTEFVTRRRKRRPSNLTFTVVHGTSPKKSIFASLLILYGLMVLMLGVVIPISDALAKPVEHADYRQMYYIFMHGMGIICVIYLNSLISCYQHHRAASLRVRNKDGEATAEAVGAGRQPEEVTDAVAHANALPSQDDQSSGSRNSSDDHPSRAATLLARSSEADHRHQQQPQPHGGGAQSGEAEIELMDISTMYEEYGPSRLEEPLAAAASAAATSSGGYCPRNPRNQRGTVTSLRRRLISGVSKKLSSSWRTPMSSPDSELEQLGATKGITWSAVGINLYLRLGAIVFGFGVMVHDGFKIADVIENPGSQVCIGPWFLPKQCIHLIFIMCQTYYVFKHHRVAINTQTVFVRFSFVHLIVTNLCIWVKTVIYEIRVGLTHHNDDYSKAKHPASFNLTGVRKAAVGMATNFTMSHNDTQG